MFPLLVRRAIFSVAYATRAQPLFLTAFKSPIISNRPFSSTPTLLFAAAAKVTAGTKAPKAKTSGAATASHSKAKLNVKAAKSTVETKKKTKTVDKSPPSTVKKLKIPTRRVTAYNVYLRQRTKGVKSMPQLAQIAQDWKNMSEREKEGYNKIADVERSEKLKVFDEFMENVSNQELNKYNSERKKKGRFAVRRPKSATTKKRPLNGFMMFMQETRRKPENRIRPAVDVAVEAGQHWRAMASDAKENYNNQAAAQRNSSTVGA